MLIAQVTDCHVTFPDVLISDRVDSYATLTEAVAHVNALRPKPTVVLATGDLVHDGEQIEYDRLREALAGFESPVLAVPGNHDDRSRFRAMFPSVPAGDAKDPIDYVIDDYALRLIGLDTTEPGRHGGQLDHGQLVWLDRQLSAEPDRPTLIFQHHPPFVTGIAWMDDDAFFGADDYAEVLSRHRNVEAIVSGHLHRSIHRRFGGTVASCWPSTSVQLALALDGERFLMAPDPAAVAVHWWNADHGLTSHLSPIGSGTSWAPSWAPTT